MKRRTVRSPGRKRGTEPGLLARQQIEFEHPDELQAHFRKIALTQVPFWEQQIEAFQAYARRFSDREIMQGELTTAGKAGEVLWWADCLRRSMQRGDTASAIADASMHLAGAMVELTVLANESSILVGMANDGTKAGRTSAVEKAKRNAARQAEIEKLAKQFPREKLTDLRRRAAKITRDALKTYERNKIAPAASGDGARTK